MIIPISNRLKIVTISYNKDYLCIQEGFEEFAVYENEVEPLIVGLMEAYKDLTGKEFNKDNADETI